jgi:hypothetical protein
VSEVIIQIKRQFIETPPFDKLMRAITVDLYAAINQRVFQYGLLSSGAQPPAYSTTPLYASTKISSDLSPLGKNGKSKFISGKKKGETKKTRYIEGGYKELKEKIGRKNRFDFTGQLKKAFTSYKVDQAVYVLGFAGTSRFRADQKPTSTTHEKIVDGLEEKYGPVFDLTKQEIARIDQILETELDLILK